MGKNFNILWVEEKKRKEAEVDQHSSDATGGAGNHSRQSWEEKRLLAVGMCLSSQQSTAVSPGKLCKWWVHLPFRSESCASR